MINNRTLYAIRALSELAESDQYSSTAEAIAESRDIPKKFLPQILSDMSRVGLVRSTRGFGGGVNLSRPPEKINLLEIIQAVQGNVFIYDHVVGRGGAPQKADATLMKVFKKIQDNMQKELAGVTLAQLASKRSGKKKTRKK